MSKKYVIEIKTEYEDSFKGLLILGAEDRLAWTAFYMDELQRN